MQSRPPTRDISGLLCYKHLHKLAFWSSAADFTLTILSTIPSIAGTGKATKEVFGGDRVGRRAATSHQELAAGIHNGSESTQRPAPCQSSTPDGTSTRNTPSKSALGTMATTRSSQSRHGPSISGSQRASAVGGAEHTVHPTEGRGVRPASRLQGMRGTEFGKAAPPGLLWRWAASVFAVGARFSYRSAFGAEDARLSLWSSNTKSGRSLCVFFVWRWGEGGFDGRDTSGQN